MRPVAGFEHLTCHRGLPGLFLSSLASYIHIESLSLYRSGVIRLVGPIVVDCVGRKKKERISMAKSSKNHYTKTTLEHNMVFQEELP